MRVSISAIIAAVSFALAVPAAAQNQVATSNQAATAQKAPSKDAKSRQAAKPGDLICKRRAQGKICLTAEKWKQYEEMM